jgi:hypothetical protein
VYGRENQSILSGKKGAKELRILATENDLGSLFRMKRSLSQIRYYLAVIPFHGDDDKSLAIFTNWPPLGRSISSPF